MPTKYGRGTFNPHEKYLRYIEFIANHLAYKGMPNAIDPSGKINWQVSSGETTSFNKYYDARGRWWIEKADQLGIPGTGKSKARFSITARLVHPTKLRPCYICGEVWNVGYMYLNAKLAKRWNKITKSLEFHKNHSIIDASNLFQKLAGESALTAELKHLFPERVEHSPLPSVRQLFLNSGHIKTTWLSPGFMANPPDRFDGFHDYGLCCRSTKDPGRSKENLQSYIHDRRAFEWWAEGDWLAADRLFNQAGAGKCSICGKHQEKISPDHVGPLACGFKHIPFFEPLCNECNSSKNRRFTFNDVKRLVRYETGNSESAASWQVRSLWDASKAEITSDEGALLLSNLMRSLQDYYLRTLHTLFENGLSFLLVSFLSPKNAYYDVVFQGLNSSTLQYESYEKTAHETKSRRSLAARSVRIAFEELVNYAGKELEDRKLKKVYNVAWEQELRDILTVAEHYKPTPEFVQWDEILRIDNYSVDEKEKQIQLHLKQLDDDFPLPIRELRALLFAHFERVGIELSNVFISNKRAFKN
jgi:Alw26I/Eco31I/Esp3I family type II restriction endonuclease